MIDGLGKGTRLGKMVDHENGVTLFPREHSDGVSGVLLLRRRNRYTGEANKSNTMQGTAQFKQ